MAFPTVIYVKRYPEQSLESFSASAVHGRLVGNDPVEIATYRLVTTQRWKRVMVSAEEPRPRSSPPARTPSKRRRWTAPL